MRSFKSLLIAAAFIAIGTSAFAADATVTFVSGKVEVQRNGKWVALQKGDTVAKSETISTGFQSEAKIKMMESVMYLGPVTRITLEELSTVDQTDNVNVYLKTGTARSQVKHVENKRVNYQVHTAVAVASCRGTGWIAYDSNTFTGTENEFAVSVWDENASIEETNMNGTIVRENQVITVSDDSTVSEVVSTIIKTAQEVTGTVGTAGSKEGEGGAGVGGGAGGDLTTVTPEVSGTVKPTVPTATVVVTLEIPE